MKSVFLREAKLVSVRGAGSILRSSLTSIGIPIVGIRRSQDCLISTVVFPVPVRLHLCIESAPMLQNILFDKYGHSECSNVHRNVNFLIMLQPGYLFWKISRSLEHVLLKLTVEYEICIPAGSQIGFCERGWFNIKIQSYQYRNSHCGDKTISGLSYLHSGISCAGKTAPLYWICPHVAKHFLFDKYRHSECSNVHLNVNFLIMLQPWYLFWKISRSLEYLSLKPTIEYDIWPCWVPAGNLICHSRDGDNFVVRIDIMSVQMYT